jgi:hypothetical protein
MKQFQLSIPLLLLLLFTLITHHPHAQDTTEPELIGNPIFDRTTISVGESLKVKVQASDDDSGVSFMFVYLSEIYTNAKTVDSFELDYNSTSGFWETDIQITQYFPFSLMVNQIQINDNAGNMAQLFNSTDFTSPQVVVFGTTPDTTTPTLLSLEYEINPIAPGTIATVFANFTDTESGMSTVWLFTTFVTFVNGTNIDGFVPFWFQYDHTLHLWKLEFTTPNEEVDIIISQIAPRDNVGNNQFIISGFDYTSPVLQVRFSTASTTESTTTTTSTTTSNTTNTTTNETTTSTTTVDDDAAVDDPLPNTGAIFSLLSLLAIVLLLRHPSRKS